MSAPHAPRKGEANPRAKLTKEEASDIIWERHHIGTSFGKLAKDFNISKTQVQRICKGKNWV
jgi:hypothetical protein